MPYGIQTAEPGPVLTLRHTGIVTIQEIERSYRELQQRGAEQGLVPILVDVREAEAYPDEAELFLFFNNAHFEARIATKVAILVGQRHRKSIDFLMLVANSRGLIAQVFDDECAAMDWISG